MFFLMNSKYILEYISKKQRIKQHILRIRHPKSTSASGSTIKRTHDIITDMPLLKYLNIAKTNRLTSNPPAKRIQHYDKYILPYRYILRNTPQMFHTCRRSIKPLRAICQKHIAQPHNIYKCKCCDSAQKAKYAFDSHMLLPATAGSP